MSENVTLKTTRSRSITVAMISYYYYPEYSGAAKQAMSLIKALKKLNIESFVISARLSPKWPQEEIIDDVKIIRVPVKSKHSPFYFWIGVGIVLWKRRHQINVVHSHGMNPDHGFSLFFGSILGKKTIGKLSIAQSDINFTNQGRIIGRLHKWFLKYADRYISISTELMNELSKSGLSDQKCIFVPNGVDLKRFHPVTPDVKKSQRKILGLEENNKILLFVGVIDHRKGIDVLINAFSRVIKKHTSVRLILVGPQNREDKYSTFYNSIIKLINDLGISKNIEFRDYTPSVKNFYQLADFMVLPSRQEGMPNVLLEAAACGLPLIGTKISGIEDIIRQDVNGILVPPNDVNSLSNAIISLLDDDIKMNAMGKKSLELAYNYYDINIIAKKYYNLYFD